MSRYLLAGAVLAAGLNGALAQEKGGSLPPQAGTPVRTADALALVAADPKASAADRWNASQALIIMTQYMPVPVWRANRDVLLDALKAEREKLPDGVIRTLMVWGYADCIREVLGEKLRGHSMEIPVLERISDREYAVSRLLAVHDAAPPVNTDNIALSKRWHVAEALIRQRDKRGIDIKLECLKAEGQKVSDPIVFRNSQHFIFTRLRQILGPSFGYGPPAAGEEQLDQAIARMIDWWQANRRTWTFSEQRLRLVLTQEPILPAGCTGEPVGPTGPAPETAAQGKPAPKAGPRGRYRTLLQKIEVPGDRASYGDFCDYGYYTGTSYAGHTNLPAGYWVYLYPHWYIYRDDATAAAQPRAWGPEQATGAPNTPQAGDIQTAWASATADGQKEWLELSYAQPVRPVGVLVCETYNPGALSAVSVFDADGKETRVWSGADPTSRECEKGVSAIPFQTSFAVARVRLYIDSPKVGGWNEIDAVGLLDEAGKTHWAIAATASSSYADR